MKLYADYGYSSEVISKIPLVNYYYTSDITSSSYSRIRSNLGAGWSWSFPSVQPVKSNYNDYNKFEMPEAIYYHDGKGNVMFSR